MAAVPGEFEGRWRKVTRPNPYEELWDLPHHVSSVHPPLSRDSYAAQFSPFSALTGYDGILEEIARDAAQRPELDEDAKYRIGERVRWLLTHNENKTVVSFKVFFEDSKKAGGTIRKVEGILRSWDPLRQTLTLTDGVRIALGDVIDISGPFPDEEGQSGD